jgi:hypothetical protein
MPKKENGTIVETPTEARQAEPGPSILVLLVLSLTFVIVLMGGLWFLFFRT